MNLEPTITDDTADIIKFPTAVLSIPSNNGICARLEKFDNISFISSSVNIIFVTFI